MVLQVQRASGSKIFTVPQRDEARRPAGFWAGATACVHGSQVFVLHEWVHRARWGLQRQQGIPLKGIDLQR